MFPYVAYSHYCCPQVTKIGYIPASVNTSNLIIYTGHPAGEWCSVTEAQKLRHITLLYS